MPLPTNQAAYEAAATAFSTVVQGNIAAIAAGPELGVPLPADFNFTAYPPYTAAKTVYVNQFTVSLDEIELYQARGIAHYNPAYLLTAGAFRGSVAGAELDTVGTQPELLAGIEMYGDLYNAGTWSTILTWLRQREIGRYSASFLGWYKAGGVNNHQALDMSLRVNYTDANGNAQLQTISVGTYWTLDLLKGAIDDLYGNPNYLHSFDVTGPSGALLSPNTQTLIGLGLNDGDTVAASLRMSSITAGPGSPYGPGGIFGPGGDFNRLKPTSV